MINAERSYTEYNVEVPTTDFPIGFDILDDGIDVVAVTLNGVDPTTIGYTVLQVNNTTYRFAPPVESGVVRLSRVTDIDRMAHVFTEGAIFVSENMDGNFKQIRHSQQEVKDAFSKLSLSTGATLTQFRTDLDSAIVTANTASSNANAAAVVANSAAVVATQAAADLVDTNLIVLSDGYTDVTLTGGSTVPNMNKRILSEFSTRGYITDGPGGWGTAAVIDGNQTQKEINLYGGKKYDIPVVGYPVGAVVRLDNGDIVKSTEPNNTANPNVDMTGWVNPQKEQDILNDFSVNVDSFARYNTNEDWYNAIDKAVDKLITKGGGTLNFNPKTYTLKTPFSRALPDNIKINIQAVGATIDARTIKGSVAGDTTIFSIGGSVLTNSQLAADVAAMSSDITLSSNLSLKKGDILKIVSTDLFEPSRAYYVKGEFVQVVSVSGNIIKTAGATYDAYTATTTKAEKLAMPNVTVNGLSILCDANQTGLELIYCRNPSAFGCTVNGSRYTGIRFYYCIGGDVTRNNISDGWYVGTGTSYNIAVASCQDFTVQNNQLREARHNIASGGTLPCRNIRYLYNDCFTHPSNGNFAAIDAHSNGEYFQIIGNNCESIVVSARHLKIRDNIIRSNKPDYQCLAIQPYLNDGRYELENNDVKATGVNSSAFYFAAVVPSVVTELLKISGGNLESASSAIRLKPRVGTAIGNIIKDLKIIDVSATGVAIDSTGDAKLTIQNISTTRLESKNGIDGLALLISQDSVVDNFTSTEDTYQRDSLNAPIGRITAKKVTMTLPTIKGESSTLKSRGFEFNGCENVKVVSPTIENCTVAIELTGSAGVYIESGRTVSNSVKTIYNTAGSTIAESETLSGNLILSATAIPTVGSYTVGDYIRNTANTIITGTPNKRLIGWYRATTGSGRVLGVDWIAEYAVLG